MDIKKYIAIKYEKHGASESGVDCLGLVSLFYKNEFNINIKDISWKKKETPSYGDVVSLNNSKHVGIVLDPENKKMMHASNRKNVCIETYYGDEFYGA